ncbi:MAG TPA: VOC family protein [Thermomicrobiales bacterium]|jgi:uncharacterized glyoxalase superfamily protein PhnB|nr:VOC family protein [Thermomicrobiales bacterium]
MTATMFPWICYPDTDRMIDWLQEAFGFELIRSFPDETGASQHAELRLGDGVVLIQQDRAGYDVPAVRGTSTGRGVNVVLESEDAIQAIRDRAAAAGGTILIEPEVTGWGNYRCEVIDPEGTQWSFGVYRPGEPDDPDAGW